MAKKKKRAAKGAGAMPWLIAGGAGLGIWWLWVVNKRQQDVTQGAEEDVLVVETSQGILEDIMVETQGISRAQARKQAKRHVNAASLNQLDNKNFRLALVERLVGKGISRRRATRMVQRAINRRLYTPGTTYSVYSPVAKEWASGNGKTKTINYDYNPSMKGLMGGTWLPGGRTVFH